MLRRCFPTAIRRALDTLPESLDETYERILLGIDKEKQKYARRLFQCLTVSIRPLHVEELAEILAVQLEDGQDSEYDTEWRPEDAQQAVLLACSSLITIVNINGSPVVQFAHFSVKEFLTSDRLRRSAAGKHLSRYHISLRSAHTALAQACLLVLLSLDENVDKGAVEKHALAVYAARHWVDHGNFEDVSSSIQDLMERLFDQDKPYFATWVWIYDFNHPWDEPMTMRPTQPMVSPIYYAALCGFPSVIDYLVVNRRGDVDARGGRWVTPLNAASAKGHMDVCLALLRHGADKHFLDDKCYGPLHIASQGGHRDVAKLLLEHHVDVNSHLETGTITITPLYVATFSGKLVICRLLLEYGADPNFLVEEYTSPLHLASVLGELEIVKVLHDYGASLQSCDRDGCTPLLAASQHGHPEIVQFLLECGADVASRDDDGTALLFQVALNLGYFDLAHDLLVHGADANEVRILLHQASRAGNLEIVQFLVRYGTAIDEMDIYEETPLVVALREGKFKIAQFLIEEGANLMSEDMEGQTPLHIASRHGDLGIIRMLLSGGVDVDVRNAHKKTPLHLTSGDGKLETSCFLIKRGASVNCCDENGCTPLHTAAGNGHRNIVALLLETGADVHAQNANQENPLMLAACGGHLDVSRVLIENEADLNTVSDEGWTSLHLASRYGHPNVVRLLLDHGADSNFQNADLLAPLHLASAYGHLDVAKLLVERGAVIGQQTKYKETPLGYASGCGHLEVTRFLIRCAANVQLRHSIGRTVSVSQAAAEGGHTDVVESLLESDTDVNVRDCHDISPLNVASHNKEHKVSNLLAIRTGKISPEEGSQNKRSDAVEQSLEGRNTETSENIDDERNEMSLLTATKLGRLDVIRSLLDCGADINTRTTMHETPLIVASMIGRLNVAHLLIDRGADVGCRDCEGKSALHWAPDFLEIVQLLLDHGADIDAMDEDHCTPLIIASRDGHFEVVELLIELGANVNTRGDFGMTPLRAAKFSANHELVQLLQKYGART